MYCKNCGTQINEKQKFCPKCGLKNHLEPINDITKLNKFTSDIAVGKTMNKKLITSILIFILLVIVIVSVALITGNRDEVSIVGNWRISDMNNPYEYPFQLCFYENGTFLSEELEDFGSYTLDDNYITTIYDGTVLWEYELHKNTLKLHCLDADYKGFVEYIRV